MRTDSGQAVHRCIIGFFLENRLWSAVTRLLAQFFDMVWCGVTQLVILCYYLMAIGRNFLGHA